MIVRYSVICLAMLLVLPAFAFAQTDIAGQIFYDADASNVTLYEQEIDTGEDGYNDVAVTLLSSAGYRELTTINTVSVPGAFTQTLTAEEEYAYAHLNISNSQICTGHNRGFYTGYALVNRDINVVAFGNIVAETGDTKAQIATFDGPLALTLGKIAGAEAVTMNTAFVANSTASSWLPETGENWSSVESMLADADLVVFTLGLEEILAASADPVNTDVDLDQVIDDIETIYAEIKETATGADVVFVIPPNFSLGADWPLDASGTDVFTNMTGTLRISMTDIDTLILADLYLASDVVADFDALLEEADTLGTAGHIWLANEVFKALGGFVAADFAEDVENSRLFGFNVASEELMTADELPLADNGWEVADSAADDDDSSSPPPVDDGSTDEETALDDGKEGWGCWLTTR